MAAMAEASGLSIPEAIIVGGYTDFLDVVSAAAGGAGFEDDCTAVITPDALSGGAGFLAQTWDMNASATPHVIMLDIHPDHGPRSLVFTTVGTLGQIGMKSRHDVPSRATSSAVHQRGHAQPRGSPLQYRIHQRLLADRRLIPERGAVPKLGYAPTIVSPSQ